MKEVLVIGGSRFIGKHLVQLLAKNRELHLTIVNRGNTPAEEYVPEGGTHIKVDRERQEELEKALSGKKFDLLFDVCAITKEHVDLLLNVMKGNIGRHIHVSTGSVYAEEDALSLPITEDFPFGPINENQHPYMNNKRGAEYALMEAYADGYPVTIIRPTFVYGPDNYIYREAYFFDRIAADRPIILPEKGFGFQDLVHVDDVATLLVAVATAPAELVLGEAFNATRGRIMTATMYAKTVAEIIGKEAKIEYVPFAILEEVEWPRDLFLYPYIPEGGTFFSSAKAEKLLNYQHIHDYKSGLRSTYEWWQQQEHKEPNYMIEDLLIKYLHADPAEKPNIKESLQKAFATRVP